MSGTHDAAVRTFTCPHCGATQRFDPATRTLSCPFCGTNLELDPAPERAGGLDPARGPRDRAVRAREGRRARTAARLARHGVLVAERPRHPRRSGRHRRSVCAALRLRLHRACELDGCVCPDALPHRGLHDDRFAKGNKEVKSREVPYTVWYPESGQHDGTHRTLRLRLAGA